MSLPIPIKTWQLNVNQAVPQQGTNIATNQKLMRMIKNSLIGFALHPWTVSYSCDGSVAGTAGDAVDRWTADNKLLFTDDSGHTLAASWIVLKQTGILANFQILIWLNGETGVGTTSVGAEAQVWASPSAGFTGGTTTARPTATDEIRVLGTGVTSISAANVRFWGPAGNTNNFASVLHVWQSTDGACTRVVIHWNNYVTALWIFDAPNNPVTGWTNPWAATILSLAGAAGNTGDVARIAYLGGGALGGAGQFLGKFSSGATPGTFLFSCEAVFVGNANAGNPKSIPEEQSFLNDLSVAYPLLPIGIYSESASARGRHGHFYDLWYGVVSGVNSNDTYPADASRQFVQLGQLVMPWNGTVPITA